MFLHSQPSYYLDQDIPILLEDSLIMYNITKKAIVHQHYSLPEGRLTHTRWFKWPGVGFEIATLDLIALRDKQKGTLTVMDLTEPDTLSMELEWFTSFKLFASRHGKNNLSDKSGLFGLTFSTMLTIGHLPTKSLLFRLDLGKSTPEDLTFNHIKGAIVVSESGERQHHAYR